MRMAPILVSLVIVVFLVMERTMPETCLDSMHVYGAYSGTSSKLVVQTVFLLWMPSLPMPLWLVVLIMFGIV